ncbi:MAG: Vitamin K epoxide reductase [Parcubacteria group bacterium Gr01-1014_20]|nr:MAG: Vitamin K epoxide reductase [Parcubacteria group bacterium Gr01-1014_20]
MNLEPSSSKTALLPKPLVSKALAITFLVVAFLGFLDATYLSVEHFRGVIPPCTIVEGCEKVTTSEYSVILGVPVALLGSIYYLFIIVLSILFLDRKNEKYFLYASYLNIFGLLAAIYFVFIQLVIIKAICIYCMFSALTSTLLFILGLLVILKSRRSM